MGNKIAVFSEEQLEDYQDCTFFTRKEILRIFERFRDMGETGVVPKVMTSEEALKLKLPLSSLAKIPEFKENPFRERIADVFTNSHDLENSEGICFNEFLEMMSVFSEQAPRDLKVFYAFKIYGKTFRLSPMKSERKILNFDDDGVIGINDLEKTCRHLVKDGLNSDEVSTICRKVLEESDIDCDDALSYLEFEHVVTRASDFLSTFHIRI